MVDLSYVHVIESTTEDHISALNFLKERLWVMTLLRPLAVDIDYKHAEPPGEAEGNFSALQKPGSWILPYEPVRCYEFNCASRKKYVEILTNYGRRCRRVSS